MKHDTDPVRPHRKFDLTVCNHIPLCTCCIAVSCSSSAPFLAFRPLSRAYRAATCRCKRLPGFSRATRTSITVVSKFPTKPGESRMHKQWIPGALLPNYRAAGERGYFVFLHCFGSTHLKVIKSRCLDNGLVRRMHGNSGHLPYNVTQGCAARCAVHPALRHRGGERYQKVCVCVCVWGGGGG